MLTSSYFVSFVARKEVVVHKLLKKYIFYEFVEKNCGFHLKRK